MLGWGNQWRIHKIQSENVRFRNSVIGCFSICPMILFGSSQRIWWIACLTHSVHILEGCASHAGRVEEGTEAGFYAHFLSGISPFLFCSIFNIEATNVIDKTRVHFTANTMRLTSSNHLLHSFQNLWSDQRWCRRSLCKAEVWQDWGRTRWSTRRDTTWLSERRK